MSYVTGTWVRFTADARLRKITDKGVTEQKAMNEGLLIGERKEGVLVQPIGTEAYTVIFPETNHFGWCYNFEFYPISHREPYKLTLKPVKNQ